MSVAVLSSLRLRRFMQQEI